MPEPAHHLTLFSDVAFEHSKTTAILSDNDISHGLSKNVSKSVSYIEEIKHKDVNKVTISQININSTRNKIKLSPKVLLGNINILMDSETKIDMSFPISQFAIQGFTAPFRQERTQILAEEYLSLFEITFLPNY